VYVANKSQNPSSSPTKAPNYTTFTIDNNGVLTPVENGVYNVSLGTSPTQVLLSSGGNFLFGSDHQGYQLTPRQGSLRSFLIADGGLLSPTLYTPLDIPGGGGAIGLALHPQGQALYVGFGGQSAIGAYDVNLLTGRLTFRTRTEAGPNSSYMRLNAAGSNLYALNKDDNSVSVYSTADAYQPVAKSKIQLSNSGPLHNVSQRSVTSSQPYSLALARNEQFLYVVCQHTNPLFDIGNYNFLHLLNVDKNGNLSENTEAIQLPVSNTVRPGGMLAFKIR
jgi:6-phosphogluconolactonase (cycloisomerase 2 family)